MTVKKKMKIVRSSGHSKGDNFGSKKYEPALVVRPDPQQKTATNHVTYKKKCRYCEKLHWRDECPSFRFLNERKEKNVVTAA